MWPVAIAVLGSALSALRAGYHLVAVDAAGVAGLEVRADDRGVSRIRHAVPKLIGSVSGSQPLFGAITDEPAHRSPESCGRHGWRPRSCR